MVVETVGSVERILWLLNAALLGVAELVHGPNRAPAWQGSAPRCRRQHRLQLQNTVEPTMHVHRKLL